MDSTGYATCYEVRQAQCDAVLPRALSGTFYAAVPTRLAGAGKEMRSTLGLKPLYACGSG